MEIHMGTWGHNESSCNKIQQRDLLGSAMTLSLNLIGISVNPIHAHTDCERDWEGPPCALCKWKSLHSLKKIKKRINLDSDPWFLSYRIWGIDPWATIFIKKTGRSRTTFKPTKQKQQNTPQSIVRNNRIHEPISQSDKRYKR